MYVVLHGQFNIISYCKYSISKACSLHDDVMLYDEHKALLHIGLINIHCGHQSINETAGDGN